VFDVEAGTVTFEQDPTPSRPDHALLASRKVLAPDDATLERLHVAMALLRHASGGRAAIVEGDGTVSRAQVDHRFCLGPWAAKLPVPPHLVVHVDGERWLLSWHLHADDWDMPLHQRFAWERFDTRGGAWLGRGTAEGATFRPDIDVRDPALFAAAHAYADTLRNR
jgi:hypothetical protein